MRCRFIIICTGLLLLSTSLSGKVKVLSNVGLSSVKPSGWISVMMNNQKENFTGKLDKIGFPFTQGGWGTTPFLRTKNGVTTGFWVPYEQTAYYYDGMLRCGMILNDKPLLDAARKAIYASIDKIDSNGVIGSEISVGEMRRWPHSILFRAFAAEFETTQNPKVLEALIKHYKNDTVTFVGRDLCNIETLTWLYKKTGDKYFYNQIMKYEKLLFAQDSKYEPIINDFASANRQEIHSVTYHEFLKIPLCFYELTGNRKYLDMVKNAFEKCDKYSLLPDGIPSSEEGLSGNTSTNTHEMCNVVDYMWTCNYMLRLTQEVEWCDRMERAIFNAGLGGITKNFDAHQYYSAPNQIECSERSSIVSTYETSRLAFRQIHRPPCCTGNLNRMFPIYVGSEWMEGSENEVYKTLYGAGTYRYASSKGAITFTEESTYPFGNIVKIIVSEGNDAWLKLNLRIPAWCQSPEVKVNGEAQKNVIAGKFYTLQRNFKKGDIIELNLPKKAEFVKWNYESMTVNYGPLLFALKVEGTKQLVDVHTPKLQSNTYKGYNMAATSDWNYILGVADAKDTNLKVIEREVKENENPWDTANDSPVKILVPAFKDASWKLEYRKITLPSGDEIFSPVTPKIPARGSMIYALNGLNPVALELVPYGSTLLRISMFPFWKQGEIAPEILATDTKN